MFSKLFEKKQHNIIFGVAGSRKTSLAISLAKERPDLKFLYLSFGRENSLSAKGRFPQNSECLNFHAFAKRIIGLPSKQLADRLTMQDVATSLSNCELKHKPQNHHIEFVTILLEHFCISDNHIKNIGSLLLHKDFATLNPRDKQLLGYFFTQFWILSFSTLSGKISHDMYLKEATMQPCIIHHDVLIVDEAQDCNDAMYKWVDNMKAVNPNLKTLMLGDPTQQIFSFIGASKRFLMEEPDFCLSRTYRFGSELASVTNRYMSQYKLPYYREIETTPSKHTVVEFYQGDTLPEECFRSGIETCIVSRFNITIWNWMFYLSKIGITYHVIGNTHLRDIDFIKRLLSLFNTGHCSDKRWSAMGFENLKREFDSIGDRNGYLACRFIEQTPNLTNKEIEITLRHLSREKKNADVILTTIHQAKGLEFESVVMSTDFIDAAKKNDTPLVHQTYTAMTRAKSVIRLPSFLRREANPSTDTL